MCKCSHKQQLSWFTQEVLSAQAQTSQNELGYNAMQSSAPGSDALNLAQLSHLHPHAQVNSTEVNSPLDTKAII